MGAASSSLVATVLTKHERNAFLANFVLINPQQDGAHVDDVLEMLYDTDSHCDEIDALHTENESGWNPCASFAVLAVKYIYGGHPVLWDQVSDILKRLTLNGSATAK